VLENELDLPLLIVFSKAYPNTDKVNLLEFFHDRLKVFLRDQDIRHDIIDAAIAMEGSDDLMMVSRLARALAAFLETVDGENLLQGFKRANNIVMQAEQNDGVEYSYGADIKFAETDEERALFKALETNEPVIKKAIQAQDFTLAMKSLASLRAPVDGFFEGVQVNTDKQVIRRNRLNLLSKMRSVCLAVADLSRIEG
jgi:glycyl-tRNA synthetase beta chain